MFAVAHALIASQIVGSEDSLVLLGGIYPDYIWNNRTIRHRRNIHYDPFGFYQFVQNDYRDMVPFAKGVLLHSDISHGLDWYSDDCKHGYAMLLGKQLIPAVQKAFFLDPIKAADFSHNFIEAAFDLVVASDYPQLAQKLIKIKPLIVSFKIDAILAVFSDSSLRDTRQAIEELSAFYLRKNLQSEKLIISVCLARIAKSRFAITDRELIVKLTPILKNALDLVYPTYQQFLSRTITSMQHDSLLKSYLG